MTDPIDGDATIVLDTSENFRFKVHIDATSVRMQKWWWFPNPFHWVVDECVGLGIGFDFRIDLPEEDCFIKVGDGGVYMDVAEIQCPTVFQLPDGRKASGLMRGQACKSWPHGRGVWQVDPVRFGGEFDLS